MKTWNTFTKRIRINKPIDSVYRSWATKGQIETWFLEKADYFLGSKQRQADELVQKGDSFLWKWNNWDFIEKGQVLEANGKDLISFTFGSGGIVTIKLIEIANSTEIELTQKDIPTDDKSKMEIFVGCITGWTFWLTNLKAYLEYSVTLHAKGLQQEETKDLVNS
ncbi:MAG: SRPBCC domain-containing protein [Ignavibacterium sp.]|nr:SRPBCC domain-containing protein [Ignavibacterium sp.]